MQQKSLLLLMAVIFIACGDSATNNQVKTEKKIHCIEVLNKNTLQKLFKEVKEVTPTSESEKYCAYKFKLANETYYTHLSIGGITHANEAMLEQSVSISKERKLLTDVGEKAYQTSIGAGQISAYDNGNLIHVSVSSDDFDEKRTKLLTNDILKRMR